MSDSFNTRTKIEVGNRSYDIYSLQRLAGQYSVNSLLTHSKSYLKIYFGMKTV